VDEPRRRLPAAGVVLVGVPGADEPAVLDLPVAQRPPLMGAAVVEGPVALVGPRQAQGPPAGHDGGDLPDRERSGVDLHPTRRCAVHTGSPLSRGTVWTAQRSVTAGRLPSRRASASSGGSGPSG